MNDFGVKDLRRMSDAVSALEGLSQRAVRASLRHGFLLGGVAGWFAAQWARSIAAAVIGAAIPAAAAVWLAYVNAGVKRERLTL